ncbi:ArnT family glycosyltransferase [Candidatus Omnitrophota bacterium]
MSKMDDFCGTVKSKYSFLLVLVFFFLLVRFSILFSAVDNLIYDDELGGGTLAKAVIDGFWTPLFDCADSFRWGGQVVTLAVVPFFLLFGETLLVLRVVAMFFSLITLIVLYLFLFRFFNRRVAIVASLLFILSPPTYTKMSFVCWGGYTEINFLVIFTLLIFYKIFFISEARHASVGKREVAPRYRYALFGIFSGFALFYDYSFLLALFCYLFFWFIFDRRLFFKKNFYIFCIFFLLGFTPWFVYNQMYNWDGLFVIRGQSIIAWYARNSLSVSLSQFKDLVVFHIPRFFSFKDFFFIPGSFISYFYYLIFVLSFVGLFWFHRHSIANLLIGLLPGVRGKVPSRDISPETFLMIYPLCFLFVYAFFGIAHVPVEEVDMLFPYRYLFPLLPFIFMLNSLFLDEIAKRCKSRIVVFYFLTVSLICLGLVGNLSMISREHLNTFFIPKGYNFVRLGKRIRKRYLYRSDIVRTLRYIENVNKKSRRFCYEGYEWGIDEDAPRSLMRRRVKEVIGNVEEDYYPFVYERLGKVAGIRFVCGDELSEYLGAGFDEEAHYFFYRGLGIGFSSRFSHDPETYNCLVGLIGKWYLPHFYEGFGMELDDLFITHTSGFLRFINSLDGDSRRHVFIGFGRGKEYREISYIKFSLGTGRIGHSMKRWRRKVNKIEDQYKPYCYQRLGIETGWRFIHNTKKYLAFLEEAEEDYRPYLYTGLGIGIGWRFGYSIDGCVRLIRQANKDLWPFIYEGLGLGVARRYGYQLDDWAEEMAKVPSAYKPYFNKGIRQALDEANVVPKT